MSSRTLRLVLVLAAATLLSVPARAQSYFGRALRFDGVDDCAVVRPSEHLPTSELTVVAWVRVPAAQAGGAALVSRRGAGEGAAAWELLLDPQGMFVFHLSDGAGQSDFLSANVVLADDAWHQLAATRRADETVQLFVDGALAATFAYSPTPTFGGREPLTFGVAGGAGHLAGWIGEVGLWRRALSASELRNAYYQGLPAGLPEACGHWTFGARGQSVFDSSRVRNVGFLGTTLEPDAADPLRVSVRATATVEVREGNGINPLSLTSERLPIVGRLWQSQLDCTGHAQNSPAFLFAYAAPLQDVFLGVGELLIDVRSPRLFLLYRTHASDAQTFGGLIPKDPALCGRGLFLQGLCGGRPGYQLSNALDLVVGFAPDDAFVDER